MKKTILHISKSTLLAIAFFGLMTLAATATAQNDTVNPLVATTGPNVLGEGHIQWNSSLEYHHYGHSWGPTDFNSHSFGLTTGFRFGIGNRAELTLDLAGAYNTFDTVNFHNTTGFTPAVGAKLLLFDGKAWVPQIAFFTHVASPVMQNAYNDKWTSFVQPEIGFEFRNPLGKLFLLDYSLGYSWDRNSVADFSDFVNHVQYSLYLRHIHSDGHMVSLGISNRNSAHTPTMDFDYLYQLNKNLQLNIRCSFAGGVYKEGGIIDRIHGLVGLNWMLK